MLLNLKDDLVFLITYGAEVEDVTVEMTWGSETSFAQALASAEDCDNQGEDPRSCVYITGFPSGTKYDARQLLEKLDHILGTHLASSFRV